MNWWIILAMILVVVLVMAAAFLAHDLECEQQANAGLQDENDSLEEKIQDLQKSLTIKGNDYAHLLADNRQLRAKIEEVGKALGKLNDENQGLKAKLAEQEGWWQRDVADLEARLKRAQKNDTRDPKTGRFIKAPV